MLREVEVPFGKTFVKMSLPSNKNIQILKSKKHSIEKQQEKIIEEALNNPIHSPSLKELSQHIRKVLIITNDNTRPMPSKVTIPAIIRNLYHPEDYYDITILIANGLHRDMTEDEIIDKFGIGLYSKYKIINHNASDKSQHNFHGKLSTGNELWLNHLLKESDLIVSEGFIEPHFFAGFSGGRKSILPGVAGKTTIMNNHSPENIANPNSRGANTCENIIHNECVEAAQMANLKFILNVALNQEKKVIAAFAGHPVNAHAEGCKFVAEAMSVKAKMTDIVITSNNGYPLDRNLYQVVKGIDVASQVVKEKGVIIVVAQCLDGVGHHHFKDLIVSCSSVEDLYERMSKRPCQIDKWQVQILARAMMKCTIILVSETLKKDEVEDMFFVHAGTANEALEMALKMKGNDASICVLPEGPVVIPVVD